MITSQIDTAPKLHERVRYAGARLITSQIDTAPKLAVWNDGMREGLITSQIDTAPKLLIRRDGKIVHIKSEVQPGNHRPGGPH